VRAAAAQALAHAPAERGEAALLAAAGDSDTWVRYHAVRALGTIKAGVARLAEVAQADPAMHVRIAAIEALGAAGGAAIDDILLAHAGDPQADLAAAAVRALAHSTDPRAAEALRAAVRAASPAVRLAAITAYRARGDADAIAALQWTAAAAEDESIALAAIDGLGAMARRPGDAGEGAVAALLMTTAETRTREAAIAQLARLPASRVGAVAAGLSLPAPGTRLAAIAALARLRHPDASAAIRTALDDPDASVREEAVIALERLGVRGVSRRLARMAREDPSRAVRRAAAAAVRADEGAR
jgi:HEAT repeat protein